MSLDPKKLRMKADSAKENAPEKARLSQLHSGTKKEKGGRGYSRFVRSMRLLLPLIAAGMIGLVVSWSRVEDTFEAIPQEKILPDTVGTNELLNPRYESKDDKNRPYTITATRAVQSPEDMDVVLLTKPEADITLGDGAWLAAKAQKGTYRQKADSLMLEGDVTLYHDQGYELKTPRMLLDLKDRKAVSDSKVSGQGPAGSIEASGMQAVSAANNLIFTGPVHLVLNREIKGLGK